MEILVGCGIVIASALVYIYLWRRRLKRTFDVVDISKMVMDDTITDPDIMKLLMKKRVRLEDRPIDINLVLRNVATFSQGYVEFFVRAAVENKTCTGTFKITKINRIREQVHNKPVIMLVKINLDPV